MRPYIVAAHPAAVRSANGIGIKPDYTLDDCPEPAIVCIPDFSLLPGASCAGNFDVEAAWLRRCHAAGATLASVCTSTSLLAATGLLDGLDATIHWAYAATLTRHHPTVRVHPNRALVTTGVGQRIVMAGGGTSHLDLALYLIGRFVGLKEALEVSKAYLINWHDAGQQPFASLHVSQRCERWIDRQVPGVGRGALCRAVAGRSDDETVGFAGAHLHSALRQGHWLVAAGVRACASARGGQADTGDRGTVDRSDRGAGGLRGRQLLRPPVPPQGRTYAGTVSPALRFAATSST